MGNRDEFVEELFYNQYERLLNKAFRITGDICMAQDIVQETFVFAMDHFKELSAHSNPAGWVSTVLYNIAMNERRLWDNSRNISLDQMGDIFPADEPANFSELLPDKLRDDEKKLLIMRFEKKMSFDEIGETLGASSAACRVRLCRLMKKIRRFFDSSGNNEKSL